MACKSMTWDGMMLVLDSCYDFCDRVGREPYFYITGGDPILRRDFWRLAEELHHHVPEEGPLVDAAGVGAGALHHP